jgi:hypothetical protein
MVNDLEDMFSARPCANKYHELEAQGRGVYQPPHPQAQVPSSSLCSWPQLSQILFSSSIEKCSMIIETTFIYW